MKGSDYSYEIRGQVILIEDHDSGGLSVTNDAANVIAGLVTSGIAVDDFKIIYRDSDGVWDGMLTKNGQFAGFMQMGCQSADHAIAKLALA